MVIAPGAEAVGQAQIVSVFSKPFELEGLFTAADAGAFGGPSAGTDGGDEVMVDGEAYWDAEDNGMGIDNGDGEVNADSDGCVAFSRKFSSS